MSNLLLNSWYATGWRSDFGSEPEQRNLLGKPIVLCCKVGGVLVAMDDRCVHRMAPLSLGKVEGDAFRCQYHGFKFGSDRVCIEIPGQDLIPPRACVRTALSS